MSLQDNFAATLKQERENRGMSMREFSDELGIALSSLVEYEAGRRIPRGNTIEHIAVKLRRSPASLISDLPLDGQTFHVCLDSLSLKIQTLHPSIRVFAKHALDLLALAFQTSDERFSLEKRAALLEDPNAQFRYVLHESNSPLPLTPSYGILVEELRDGIRIASAVFAPFSNDRLAVLNMIFSANEMQLPPDQFFSDVYPAFLPLS